MPPHEYRAAIFYEFLARQNPEKGRPCYPLKKPWPQLSKTFRLLMSVVIFPGPLDAAFYEDELATLSRPTRIMRGNGNTWSRVYPLRFNLELNANSVGTQIKAFFLDIQKQYAKPKRKLEGHANRRMSFRPIELKDKELSGALLTKVQKQTIHDFSARHKKTLAYGSKKLTRTRDLAEIDPPFKKAIYSKE